MKKIIFPIAAATSLLSSPIVANAATTTPTDKVIESSLKDDVAWDIVEGMTTEVGPRQAGTEAEARIEEFQMPTWVRGEEAGFVTAPFPHKLHLSALGNSGSTGAQGLEAEVVYFKTLDALRAAPDGSLKDKIAFVSHAMKATQDGSSYGTFGPARFVGPNLAAKKGAAASGKIIFFIGGGL